MFPPLDNCIDALPVNIKQKGIQMARREVLRMGHPVLRKKAEPYEIDEITSDETKALLKDMFDTMEAEEGIGLAAPQIGVSKQMAIIGIEKENPRYPDAPEYDLLVVFNPKITYLDETPQGFWEGCLSVPGLRGYVERPQKIQIDYLDEDAAKKSAEVEGFLATVFQHEIDHLLGTLYIDKLKDTSMLSYIEEFSKYIETEEDEVD